MQDLTMLDTKMNCLLALKLLPGASLQRCNLV